VSAAQEDGQRLRIAVGVATLGRNEVLVQTLARLKFQSRQADIIAICAPNALDLEGARECCPRIIELVGPHGLARQRNAIIDAVRDYDVLIFFDDDFVASPKYLAAVEAVMLAHPDVVMATGRLVADGILGPGIAFAEADRMLRESEQPSMPIEETYNGYGCNMSIRLAPVRADDLTFDEHLPMYGWLEDVDFSRQLAPHGRIVEIDAWGIHLGLKKGRQSGLKLGYSQVANPLYLTRKGTMSGRRALMLLGRNLLANTIRCSRAEPWVDRRGRLKGNLRAIGDLVSGRLDPVRIETL